MKTPLAWHNLTHDLRRLALAVGGIGFAVLLMFMQLGFRGALFDSTIALLQRLDADVVLVHPQRYTLSVYQKFPRRYLESARADADVIAAAPFYFENIRSTWKRTASPAGPPIRVLAFDEHRPPLSLPEIAAQAERLTEPDTALLDRRSKDDFGGVGPGDFVELNGRRIRIVGEFSLGTDFADDGTLIVGRRTFHTVFFDHLPDGEGLEQLDLGLVKLRPTAAAAAATARLQATLPDDVLVLTKPQYLEFELSFWRTATPIGYVFSLGTLMGFIVGMIICYQILFSDVADHLREFATLKAIGYRPRYFVGVVLQEAGLLSAVGFIPGTAAAWVLYASVATATGLPMNLAAERIAVVFVLTVLMCVVSGCLAMRKVIAADPAELF